MEIPPEILAQVAQTVKNAEADRKQAQDNRDECLRRGADKSFRDLLRSGEITRKRESERRRRDRGPKRGRRNAND